ncbi:hypothetical protein [Chromobacterium violaceum]|uniref:hypothetical protein n=1 Tax=Chromobacterium violaceum TaxID=536 RepID=UPI00111C8246|nr:hypothetical protein [Chromobacterium violaceum]QRO33797.1 hypothetical protein I6K04_03350 [Chromobacterium violaceum]QRQ16399.1 hypothetical protein I6K03_19380 [Chromobacterium violaceum]
MSNAKGQINEETDRLLFGALANRKIALKWASTSAPKNLLTNECRDLMKDDDFREKLAQYLYENPVIAQSIETIIANLAFSAGVHWSQADEILQPLAKRGWSISRWLPTFLLVNGPLGNLLRKMPSPLVEKLHSSHSNYPLLSNARDAFNDNFFRKVRNGFAHWSFTWEEATSPKQIKVFHYESGALEAELSVLEAEALHYLSTSVIETLDKELIRALRPPECS